MTRKEFKQFIEEQKLLTSVMFSRKCPRLIIGADNCNVWFASDIKYKISDDPEKRENDFYMYAPDAQDTTHKLIINPNGRYEFLCELFAPIDTGGGDPFVILLDWFNRELNKAYQSKLEEYHPVIKVDGTTVKLSLSELHKDLIIGERLTSADIRRIIVQHESIDEKIRYGETDIYPMIEVGMIPEFGNWNIELKTGHIPIPLQDGRTIVSVNYENKARTIIDRTLHLWPIGINMWDAAITMQDGDNIAVTSYGMNRYYITINTIQGETENE